MKTQWEPAAKAISQPKRGTAGIELGLYRKETTEVVETFSLRNETPHAVRNIVGVFVYKTQNGKVIHFRILSEKGTIPSGLALMSTCWVKELGQTFGYYKNKAIYDSDDTLYDVEFRILSYEIVPDEKGDVFDYIQR